MKHARITNMEIDAIAARVSREAGEPLGVTATAIYGDGYLVEVTDRTGAERLFHLRRNVPGVVGTGYAVNELHHVAVIDASKGTVSRLSHLRDLIDAPPVRRFPSTLLFALAWFVPHSIREGALGDAEERFRSDVARFGVGRATWLLRWDVARTAARWLLGVAEGPFLRIVRSFAGH